MVDAMKKRYKVKTDKTVKRPRRGAGVGAAGAGIFFAEPDGFPFFM